jgi:GntR family transcriptional regulator/MocR family aminotransferase
VRGVPVDRDGLVVERLPPGARLVYVTPSHQYPLGMTMALPRRLALLDWARRHGAAVVEDDYDSEFRFGGRPIEPLRTLDADGLVVYVGSFSKTLLPTLRLGFVLTPPSLRGAVQAAKYVADWHTPLPAQAALADFVDGGAFARHLRKAGLVYRARHQLLTRVLARDFADHLELVPSVAGLHVSALARTASVERVEAVARRAAEAGVEVQRLASFALEAPARPGLVLGYGAIPGARIEEGLRRLRDCFGS